MKLLLLLTTAVMTFACKSNVQDAELLQVAPVKSISRSSKTKTLLFTWTSNPLAKVNPKEFLRLGLQGAHEANQKLQDFQEGLQAGNGVYFASDPIHSYSFGNILVVVEAGPDVELGFSEDSIVPLAIIKQRTPGLFYRWNSGFVGDYAFVARDQKAIKLDTAFSMAGNSPLPFKDKAPFKTPASGDWKDAFKYVEDVTSFVNAINEGEADRKQGEKVFSKPLFTLETQKLNPHGVLAAIEAEFWHLHPNVKRGWNKLYPNGSLVNDQLPHCNKNLSVGNDKVKATKFGCAADVIRTLNRFLEGSDWRGVSISEAFLILQASEHISKEATMPSDWAGLNQLIQDQFASSGALNRANDAVAAYQVLLNHFKAWSLQNWINEF
ncbi:MAG: hypothetical protein WCI18_16280 [Pseudomonadota bacterium]